MDKAKPTRPKRVPTRKSPPVPPPLSKEDKDTFDDAQMTRTKFQPLGEMNVGKPTIKAPGTKVVTTVGLGNLTVITQDGNTNV